MNLTNKTYETPHTSVIVVSIECEIMVSSTSKGSTIDPFYKDEDEYDW